MKTFKEFLKETSITSVRTKGVDIDAFKNWCDTNAMKYLKGRKFLFRGGSGTGTAVFMLGDSNLGNPRTSANTSNNYTLWLDNHPAFKDFPKRSRSFIATTSYDTAESFGSPHFIIPADDAEIGIVGEDDLWNVDIGYNMQFEDLSYGIDEVCDFMELDRPKTYTELKNNLEDITLDALEEKLTAYRGYIDIDMVNNFLAAMKGTKTGTVFKCLEELITPKLFDRSNGANISNRNVNGEVWIQGQCAFLPIDGSSVSYTQRKEIIRWLEERAYTKFVDTLQKHWGHKFDPDEEE